MVLPVLIVWAAFSLSACAGSRLEPTAKFADLAAAEETSNREVKEMNQKLLESADNVPKTNEYTLSEGDLVEVSIYEVPNLKTETRVGARGNITLPLIGSMPVKGLTVVEAERRIEDMYRRDYIQDPHVTLFLKEQIGNRVTLVGAVNKPGTIDCSGHLTLLQVLGMSGGLSDKAGKTVQIRRVMDDPAKPYTFIIDLEEIVKRGNLQANIGIKGGDVIFVPDAGTVYVDGAVRKPGSYPVRQSMTVQEAIVAAGGLSSAAEQDDIKLVRSAESGKREVVKIGIKDLRQGTAESLLVKDRDIIFVESNLPKTLLYGLRLNLGTGLVGFGYTPPDMSASPF